MNHPQPHYHHLTLTFVPDPQHVAVRWESTVIGSLESRMQAPFVPADLPVVLRALDCLQDPRYASDAHNSTHAWWQFSPAEQAILLGYGLWDAQCQLVATDADQRVGRMLFAALTADAAAQQALASVRNHAVASGALLWLALRFPPRASELAALPWEALRDSLDQPLLLSGGQQAVCVRHLDLPLALPPILPVSRPLDLLVLAPRAGIPINVRHAERTARRAVLAKLEADGLIRLRELEPATRTALVNAIHERPADLVYFYGHGHYQDGQGTLLLDGEQGGAAWTDSQRLAKILAEAKIALLFACRGAAILPDAAHPAHGMLSGVAQALNAEGVPLVLAMQFTVRISAATRAVDLIVRDLNAGHSIQASVARLRRSLFVEEDDQRSWYVPTLTIRSREIGPLSIFPPSQAQPTGQVASSLPEAGASSAALTQAPPTGQVAGSPPDVVASSAVSTQAPPTGQAAASPPDAVASSAVSSQAPPTGQAAGSPPPAVVSSATLPAADAPDTTAKAALLDQTENPFIIGRIAPPERFYGREEARRKLRTHLGARDGGQSVQIVGWRRSGKSSLLNYVQQRINEFCTPEQDALPILLSLQNQLFQTPLGINEGLRRGIARATGNAPWQANENDDNWAINDGLAALRDSGRRLIILIDEFERIGARLAEFVDWGSDWRYKASDAGYFSLVIASLRPIGDCYAELGLDSPFGNIFLHTELDAFDVATWHQLVRDGLIQRGQQPSAAELALLDELAGGMPYYVQLAASLFWERPDPAWVREQFALQAEQRFAELLRDLNDLEAHALRYAAGVRGLVAPAPALAQRLQRLGLLRSDGRLFSSALATYLRGTR